MSQIVEKSKKLTDSDDKGLVGKRIKILFRLNKNFARMINFGPFFKRFSSVSPSYNPN
jgi:hypothetical protein